MNIRGQAVERYLFMLLGGLAFMAAIACTSGGGGVSEATPGASVGMTCPLMRYQGLC